MGTAPKAAGAPGSVGPGPGGSGPGGSVDSPFTVTGQVSVKPPSTVLTVMTALPAATALTWPVVAPTVATDSSLEDHVTLGFVASLGVIRAPSIKPSPTLRSRDARVTFTPVTATAVGPGSGSCTGSFPPQLAVIKQNTPQNSNRIAFLRRGSLQVVVCVKPLVSFWLVSANVTKKVGFAKIISSPPAKLAGRKSHTSKNHQSPENWTLWRMENFSSPQSSPIQMQPFFLSTQIASGFQSAKSPM